MSKLNEIQLAYTPDSTYCQQTCSQKYYRKQPLNVLLNFKKRMPPLTPPTTFTNYFQLKTA